MLGFKKKKKKNQMNVFGKKKILNVFVGKKNDNVISEEKLKCGNKQLTMDS